MPKGLESEPFRLALLRTRVRFDVVGTARGQLPRCASQFKDISCHVGKVGIINIYVRGKGFRGNNLTLPAVPMRQV